MTQNNPNIILVDDHKSFTYLTQHLVNHYFQGKCHITAFQDPKAALVEIMKSPDNINYVFLDISMPNMSGWDFLKELKQQLGREIPFEVVLITGSDILSDYKAAQRREDISHFIHKPLDLNKIKQVFESTNFLKAFLKY